MQRKAATAGPSPGPSKADDGDRRLRHDALRLHRALGDLLRVFQFRDRDRICCHDVSVSQCYALEALILHGSATLNELAGRLFLDKSTTSRVVDGLVAKGYVERRPHPQDGRAVLLQATAAGRQLHERIEADLLSGITAIAAEFDPAVRAEMTRLLTRLARSGAERIDASGGSCRLR